MTNPVDEPDTSEPSDPPIHVADEPSTTIPPLLTNGHTQNTKNLQPVHPATTSPLSSKVEPSSHTHPIKHHVHKNGRMMWVNTIDPWSICWIKVVVDGPDELHAC